MKTGAHVRPLCALDLPEVKQLFQTREHFDDTSTQKRLEMFKWIAFENPYSDGEPTYFLACDGSKVIGHLGRMPVIFSIGGRKQKSYFFHDLYLHPDYRKGRGFFIVRALYQAAERNSDSFCCMMWTTDLNLEFQKRMGYTYRQCPRYYKFFDPRPKILRRLTSRALTNCIGVPLRGCLRAVDYFLLECFPPNGQVCPINRFDQRFDEFAARMSSELGVCVFKSSSYLNWRYMDKPFSRMKAIAVEDPRGIVGFAVVNLGTAHDYRQGTLVDIMAAPDDDHTVSLLLRESISICRASGMHSVRCCMSDPRMSKTLRQHLFFRDFYKAEPLMLANLNKTNEADTLLDLNRWHLTYGASDELMLDS
jgi:hypothetical protein